ncbi:MAG: hypothetical protein C4576_14045 [Desulfobacteraceae bacterium]|nr:MAG: hypothetical protein C4576_14045 [Desulfobacteraceae bacterium]
MNFGPRKTMRLNKLQLQRLHDVQVSIRACMDSIQQKAERSDEHDDPLVIITTNEAFSALNVMAFVRALGESANKRLKPTL